MDFALTEEQAELQALAARIFEGHATSERVRAVESTEEVFDRDLWAALAAAHLLGAAVPEDHGGLGLGAVELCLLLEQQGRFVAPVPLLVSAMVAGTCIAAHGTPAQKARFLPRLAKGDAVLTAALAEPGANDPLAPGVRAVEEPGGWRLYGLKICVPAAHVAEAVLVPARTEAGGVGVFIVDPSGKGVSGERASTTNHEVQVHIGLEAAVVAADDVLAAPPDGLGAVESMLMHALVGLSALQLGVTEEALRAAVSYTSERQQFGRPLATNQAVALKAADAYVDVEAIRVTMLQAAWRMATGRGAVREALVAKWWASEGGHRVVHAVQHLHGGLGADIDYPVHRYFLWGKQIETALGGSSQQLARLGQAIADGARGERAAVAR